MLLAEFLLIGDVMIGELLMVRSAQDRRVHSDER